MIKNFKEAKLGSNFCKNQVAEVKRLIDSSNSFAVVGLPAMGISIFLMYLATRGFAKFVHIDINELPVLDRVGLFRLLVRELNGKANLQTEQDLLESCKKGLEKLTREQPKVVIIFNRFDRLKDEFNQNFFANLRSLRDIDKAKIVMIFAANKPLIRQTPEALTGGNLNMFSKTYYLKPYSQEDLGRLIKLNSTNLKMNNEKFKRALRLCGGHYQLLQLLLKSDLSIDKFLDDLAIKLQFKELNEYLDNNQCKQLQKIALGKKVTNLDQYLVDVGYVIKDKNGQYRIFTPLLLEYIKSNLRLKLPVKEAQLFSLLKSHEGRTVSKDEIFATIGPDQEGGASDWALNALVYRLRKNPTFTTKGYLIENHKKIGYTLIKV